MNFKSFDFLYVHIVEHEDDNVLLGREKK